MCSHPLWTTYRLLCDRIFLSLLQLVIPSSGTHVLNVLVCVAVNGFWKLLCKKSTDCLTYPRYCFLVKGVQCYELFGVITLKNNHFFYPLHIDRLYLIDNFLSSDIYLYIHISQTMSMRLNLSVIIFNEESIVTNYFPNKSTMPCESYVPIH